MTIHFFGLALAGLALLPAAASWAQDAPPSAGPRPDAGRAGRGQGQSSAAYKRLRSYSGRFLMVNPNEVQSGEIRWALPNKLSMRMETKSKRGTYTLRAVSDGKFIYIADSRLRGNFIKQPLDKDGVGAADIGSMITALNSESMMYMAVMMAGLDPLEGSGAVRITSSPPKPSALGYPPVPGLPLVLELEVRHEVGSAQGGATELTTELSAPTKMSFRFGIDNLLREFSMEESGPEKLRATEKHWEVRVNPKLPAETFQFKPAPGARQVQSLDPPR